MTIVIPRFIPAPPQQITPSQPQHKIETLPFTIRIIESEHDLKKAIKLRHAAYNRHVPEFATQLAKAEDADFDQSAIVILAESKLDGSAVGTMRVQENTVRPLALEHSIRLPSHMTKGRLAEATRLAVGSGGRVVTIAMFKAFYLFCKAQAIDTMVITARSPVDRQYERLMFRDVDPALGFIELPHVGNLKHRIMSLEVEQVEPLWRKTDHPLYNFFFSTNHADIDVAKKRGKAAITYYPKLRKNQNSCSMLLTRNVALKSAANAVVAEGYR
jgi:hypothetical protein